MWIDEFDPLFDETYEIERELPKRPRKWTAFDWALVVAGIVILIFIGLVAR